MRIIRSVVLTLILAAFASDAQILSGINNNVVNGNYIGRVTTNIKIAASFSGVRGAITGITVSLSKHGAPSGEVVVELRSGSYDGLVLASAIVGGGQIPSGSYADFSVSFPRAELVSAADTYYVVFSRSGSSDDSNYFIVGCGNQGSVFGEVASAGWAWLNSSGWTGHSVLGAPKISFNVLPAGAPPVLTPGIAIAPSSLVMDSTAVWATSQKNFTISNPGGAALSVTGIAVNGTDAGQFSVSPSVAAISPSASQTFTVSFTPASVGTKSAAVTITHNAAGSPTSVTLNGVGKTFPPPPLSSPLIGVSPVSLVMDSTIVGSASQKSFVVSNTGTATLSIGGITTGGADSNQFYVLPTAATISAGGSQVFIVTFSPASVDAKSAALSISHNASGSPTSVGLTGVGKTAPPPPAPVIGVSPMFLTMDSTVVGNMSQKAFTITNTGSAVLLVTGIAVSGSDAAGFVISQTTAVVSPGASQTVSVTFVPTSTGSKSANVAVSSNATQNPVVIALSGTAKPLVIPTPPVPVINVSTLALSMDSVVVGSTNQKVFVVSNADGGTLVISGVSVTGADAANFSVSPISATITAGGNRVVTVSFTPASVGTKSAAVTITHNAAGSPTSVGLAGVGKAVPPPPSLMPGIVITPPSLVMDSTVVGSTSQKSVAIRNDSSVALNITNVSVVGANVADFGAFVSGTVVAGSGGSRTLTVSFMPSAVGFKQAQIRIDHNGSGGVSFVSVSGIGKVVVQPPVPGTGPMIRVEPGQLQMDPVMAGNMSQKVLTLTNFGSAVLSVAEISLSGTDALAFSIFPERMSLNAGESRQALVSFKPSSDGSRRASVVFRSNAANQAVLTIEVNGQTPPKPVVYRNPIVKLSATPLTGYAPLTVKLANTNTGGLINWWEWRPGDDDLNPVINSPVRIRRDVNGDTLTYTFTRPGVYKPSLTVFGPGGSGDSQSLVDSIVVLEPLPPKLEVGEAGAEDDSLAMGGISADGKSELTFLLRNPGTSTLTGSIAMEGDSSFTVAPPTFNIVAGGAAEVTVKFQPRSAGTKNGKIIVRYGGVSGAKEEIPVSGVGKEAESETPEFSVTPKPFFVSSASSLDLGEVAVNRGKSSVSFSVGNAGAAPLTGSLFFRGDGSFSIKPDSINVLPGKIDSVLVSFAPTQAGVVEGRIYIFHNASSEAFAVTVTGEGISPAPPSLLGDFDGDGVVYFEDQILLADQIGSQNPVYDLDGNGTVGIEDFFIFADNFGKGIPK